MSIFINAIMFSSILAFAGSASSFAFASEDALAARRKRMVETQIERRNVTDRKVLAAMTKVKRHLFVPEGLIENAYDDNPLPIGQGQTISQPYIVAYMTEAVRLTSEARVLEIGTGCGYQAAVLGEIAKEVYTIEIVEGFARDAKDRFKRLEYSNIEVKHGDGYKGWTEHAPFDAIIVTAAPPEIPKELVNQLKIGGRMIVPVGTFFQELVLITRTDEGFKKKSLLPVRFVPMVR